MMIPQYGDFFIDYIPTPLEIRKITIEEAIVLKYHITYLSILGTMESNKCTEFELFISDGIDTYKIFTTGINSLDNLTLKYRSYTSKVMAGPKFSMDIIYDVQMFNKKFMPADIKFGYNKGKMYISMTKSTEKSTAKKSTAKKYTINFFDAEKLWSEKAQALNLPRDLEPIVKDYFGSGIYDLLFYAFSDKKADFYKKHIE